MDRQEFCLSSGGKQKDYEEEAKSSNQIIIVSASTELWKPGYGVTSLG